MSSLNILLIVLDSVRASNCSIYSHHNETTPFLTELAADSVVYEQAHSPSIHSISSHASIFSGYEVEEHNVTRHKSFIKTERTIWNRLSKKYNYTTGLFTPNVVVAQTSNLGECFDTCIGPKRANFRLFDSALAPFDVQGKLSPSEYLKIALRHDSPIKSVLNGFYKKLESRGGSHDPATEHASVYIDELFQWINEQSGSWAACLNLMDTHTPFLPDDEYNLWSNEATKKDHKHSENTPEPFSEEFWDYLGTLESLYDGTIRQADAAIKQVINRLAEADELDDTLVIITSDHGEGLGERSKLDPDVRLRHHSWGIDEHLTHVPLIVRTPGKENGQVVEEPATLTRFPEVVKATIEGRDIAEAFVPEGDVITSTYRIEPPGDELLLPEAERQKYFGPWRAVYRMTEEGIIKYARRGDTAATFKISDAQTVIQIDDTDRQVVENVFNNLKKSNIKQGDATDRDVDSAVEDRLADLGYLR